MSMDDGVKIKNSIDVQKSKATFCNLYNLRVLIWEILSDGRMYEIFFDEEKYDLLETI